MWRSKVLQGSLHNNWYSRNKYHLEISLLARAMKDTLTDFYFTICSSLIDLSFMAFKNIVQGALGSDAESEQQQHEYRYK